MEQTITQALITALGRDKVLVGESVKERYHHIWKMNEDLDAKAVVLPRDTQDVSDTMRLCHEFDQTVVIHGGLTNLVGSTETHHNDVVISLEKMDHIEEIDEQSRTITVQAGVILEKILDTAQEKELLFPLNFGAKGSAQIGGAISTNAGGLRVFRFGMTRQSILGLEVVLADGTVISSMKKVIKDNSAYDLKQMFIGSEGTLGIVTRAVLKLVEAPRSRNSAFIGIDKYEDVVRFLKHMDRGCAGTLSGYELIWRETFKTMTSPPSTVKSPLPYDYKYYVLVESMGGDQVKDKELMESLLEKALHEGTIQDAALAHSSSDLDWFWTIREDVHVLASQCRYDQHFDISLPIPLIGDYLDKLLDEIPKIDGVEKAFAFGHVADGNIHLIVDRQSENAELIHAINEVVYLGLKAIGGSVSAEHGIGTHKKAYLHLCRSEEEIELMKVLKRTLDPKNLLNRGKIFDL